MLRDERLYTSNNESAFTENEEIRVDSINPKEFNLSLEFFRWLNQNEGIKKVFLSPGVLPEFIHPCYPSSLLKYFGAVSSVPLSNNDERLPACHSSAWRFGYVNVTNQFFSGITDGLNKLWPLAYYGAQLHDGISYQFFPNQRYGSEMSDWFNASAKSTYSLTSHWGGDIPVHKEYWYWPGSALLIPTLLGAWRVLRNITYSKELDNNELNSLNQRLRNSSHDLIRDTFSWLYPLPWGCFQADFEKAIYKLKWDDRISYAEKIALLDTLKIIAQNHTSITQMQALYALGEIANAHRSMTANLVFRDNDNLEYETIRHRSSRDSDWRLIEREALRELNRFANPQNNSWKLALRRLYANHVLWEHGYNVGNWLKTIFFTKTTGMLALVWYSKARLFQMLLQKLVGFIDFYNQKSNCEADGKIWAYIEEWANYFCSVCPDWEDVYLGDIDTNQGCLNGVLAKKRAPEEILDKLFRVLAPDIKHIDFSRQNIEHWTPRQWQTILTIIVSSIEYLDDLNLSSEILNSPWPSAPQLKMLANFINQVRIAHIDLHNQNLGAGNAETFLDALKPPLATRLDLSNNGIGDPGARKIIELLSQPDIQLRELILTGNQISDDLVAQIVTAASQHPFLEVLNLGGNNCGQKTIDALARAILHSFKSVNLSDNEFSELDMTPLWNSLSNSTQIEALYLDKTNLLDYQLAAAIPYMPGWSLRCLSLVNNGLTPNSIDYLFQGLSNNTAMEELHLSQNPILDPGLEIITASMRGMRIKALYIDDCDVSQEGMRIFAENLKDASYLQVLSIANNNVNDLVFKTLSESISNSSLPLQVINANSNQISDLGGSALAKALPNSNLTTLILTNNRLGDEAAQAFSETLPQSKVHTFIVNQNKIGESGVKALGNVLSKTFLENIGFGGNPVGPGLHMFVQQLIRPVSRFSLDDATTISVDARRELYDNAKPNTKIKTLDLEDTGMDNPTAILTCRMLPFTDIPIVNLKADANQAVTVDMQDCRVSRSSRLSPPSTYQWTHRMWHSGKNKLAENYQWAEDLEDNLIMAKKDDLISNRPDPIFQSREVINKPREQFFPSPPKLPQSSTYSSRLFLPATVNPQSTSTNNGVMLTGLLVIGAVTGAVLALFILVYLFSKLIEKLENTKTSASTYRK